MKARRESVAWSSGAERLAPTSPYHECAFTDCDNALAPQFDFPLCPKHCQVVYLNVKELLDRPNLRAIVEAANDGRHLLRPNGKAAPLASKRVGTIYFARMGDLIKIGYTTNLKQRMRHLYTEHRIHVELLATIPGTMGTEKALQAQFGLLWERREFFRPGQELLDYIKSIAVTQDTQRPSIST